MQAGDGLNGNDARVYEFVARHFLACCAQNAEACDLGGSKMGRGSGQTCSASSDQDKEQFVFYLPFKGNKRSRNDVTRGQCCAGL
jgi:hypothetical protein